MSSLDPSARGRLYAFFSRLWVKEVDPSLADVLKGPLGQSLLPDFSASVEPGWLDDEAARQGAFDADFVHLTMVNLVPYESFYRREDGMLESGGGNPVAVFLRKYGFEADLGAARSLAPDHLGIELELLSVLCDRERQAVDDGRTPYVREIQAVERAFLEQHLLTWAPVYLFAARRSARTVLYREAAEATLEFVLEDHRGLT